MLEARVEEARRRIQECQDTQATILDLGNLGLNNDNLPPELWELAHLEELNLGNQHYYDKEKQKWEWLDHNKRYRYSHVISEQSLLLPNNDFPKISTGINQLIQLKTFLADNVQLEQLPDLPAQLVKVNFSQNSITDLKPLEKLSQLSSLSISSNKIEDLQPIQKLNQLTSLYIWNNKIEDLKPIQKLNQLTSLDISSNKIEDLQPIQKLNQLTSLYIWNNKIEDLKPIQKLNQLTSLYISDNKIEDLKPIQKLNQLTSLDISDNKIEDLKPIQKLNQLTSLNISDNKIEDLKPIQKLNQLTSLYIWNNKIEDLKPIQKLNQLTSLNISDNQIEDLKLIQKLNQLTSLYIWNTKIEDLKPIQKLNQLSSLNISNNKIADLKPIEKLNQLTSLNISNNQIEDLKPIEKLNQLTSLNISNNKIEDLKPIQKLNQLTSLNISNNKIEDLKPIQKLNQLTSLNISYNKIQDLKPIQKLNQLSSLYISNNKIQDLKPIEKLNQLSSLYISNNQLKQLPDLHLLTHLWELDLASNQITDFSDWQTKLPQLPIVGVGGNPITHFPAEWVTSEQLTGLNLNGKSFWNIPIEITEQQNCLADARAWFADLAEESVPNYQLKLIVCGNGQVGKSTLVEYLCTDKYDDTLKSTHAIRLRPWAPELTLEEKKVKLNINIWDFGGQEIYHATHRLFMQSRALYLTLWDKETQQEPYYTENGHQYRNYKISYWLDHVRSYSRSSPVLVVENKIDNTNATAIRLPKEKLEKRFGVSNFARVSAREGTGVEVLKHQILDTYRSMPEFGMPMPGSWFRCREAIETQAETLDDIDLAAFHKICDQAGVREVSRKAVLRYLHHTGSLFYREKLFDERVIINQRNAIAGIYALLDREGDFWNYMVGRGSIRYSDLVRTWNKKNIPEDKHQLLLTFMVECGLCFARNKDVEKTATEYIAPLLLPEDKPAKVNQVAQQIKDESWFLRYNYEFLHQSFIHQFIIKAGHLAPTDDLWAGGVYFQKERTDVIVECQTAADESGYIQIQVAGQNRKRLLHLVKQAFGEIHGQREEELERLVSVNGQDFVAYGKVKIALEDKTPIIRSVTDQKLTTEDFRELMAEHQERPREDTTPGPATKVPQPAAKLEDLTPDITPVVPASPVPLAAPSEQTILFLSAHPSETAKLELEKEYAAVQKELEGTHFSCRSKAQINRRDIVLGVADHQPNIIHFSGHGRAGDGKDEVAMRLTKPRQEGGIIIYDQDKRDQLTLTTPELLTLFQQIQQLPDNQLEIVVFNACYSEEQARALSELGLTVIGTSYDVYDGSAIAFASGFYRQLAKGDDIKRALQIGRMLITNAQDLNVFVLYQNGEKIEI